MRSASSGPGRAGRRRGRGGGNLKIKVRLHGVFRIDRFKEEVRDYPTGTTARAVVEQLRIPTRLVGTVLIGGVHAGIEDQLAEGDVLSILPILGGG